jgi:hypothetical protein
VEVLTKNYTQHTALDVLGTLQKAGGNTKASPGNPDLTSWSPAKLMETNCALLYCCVRGGSRACSCVQLRACVRACARVRVCA